MMLFVAYRAYSHRNSIWFALTLCVALLLVTPIWLVANQPSMDGPSHLAELYVLSSAQDPTARSPFYEVQWTATPDLAAELIVPILNFVVPLTFAAKLFLSIAVLFWAIGPSLIQRAIFGRQYATSILAALLAYNSNFINGFWNCYFGLGLALVIFALWIHWSTHLTLRRRSIFAAAFLAVYFCHLVAAVGLLVLVSGYEVGRAWHDSDRSQSLANSLQNLAVIVLPVFIAVLFRPAGSGLGETRGFFLNLGGRIHSVLQFGIPLAEKTLIPFLIIVFGIAWYAKFARVHRSSSFLIVVFAIVCLFLPVWAGGGWGLHVRYPALLCAILLASSKLVIKERAQILVSAASLACVALVSLSLFFVWKQIDVKTDEYRSALRQVPTGSKIFLSIDDRDAASPRIFAYYHFGAYAVVDRNAFFAGLLTTRGQHIVYPRSEFWNISARTSDDSLPPYYSQLNALRSTRPGLQEPRAGHPNLRGWQCKFDILTVIGTDPAGLPKMPELGLIHRGSFFSIFAIRRPSTCPG